MLAKKIKWKYKQERIYNTLGWIDRKATAELSVLLLLHLSWSSSDATRLIQWLCPSCPWRLTVATYSFFEGLIGPLDYQTTRSLFFSPGHSSKPGESVREIASRKKKHHPKGKKKIWVPHFPSRVLANAHLNSSFSFKRLPWRLSVRSLSMRVAGDDFTLARFLWSPVRLLVDRPLRVERLA